MFHSAPCRNAAGNLPEPSRCHRKMPAVFGSAPPCFRHNIPLRPQSASVRTPSTRSTTRTGHTPMYPPRCMSFHGAAAPVSADAPECHGRSRTSYALFSENARFREIVRFRQMILSRRSRFFFPVFLAGKHLLRFQPCSFLVDLNGLRISPMAGRL